VFPLEVFFIIFYSSDRVSILSANCVKFASFHISRPQHNFEREIGAKLNSHQYEQIIKEIDKS